MWEYNNFDELYHYGVPGMRWGHKRAKVQSSTIKGKKRKKKQPQEDPIDKFQKQTKNTKRLRRAGYLAKFASVVASDYARRTYNKHKPGGTPGTEKTVKDINNAAKAGKALNTIGDMAIGSAYVKHFVNWKQFMNSKFR